MERKVYYSLKEKADDTFKNVYPPNRGSLTFEIEFLISQMAEEIDYLKKRVDQLEKTN